MKQKQTIVHFREYSAALESLLLYTSVECIAIDPGAAPIIFLADEGSHHWHYKAAKALIQKGEAVFVVSPHELNTSKDKEIFAAAPKAVNQKSKLIRDGHHLLSRRSDWINYYLPLAASRGCVVFYFDKDAGDANQLLHRYLTKHHISNTARLVAAIEDGANDWLDPSLRNNFPGLILCRSLEQALNIALELSVPTANNWLQRIKKRRTLSLINRHFQTLAPATQLNYELNIKRQKLEKMSRDLYSQDNIYQKLVNDLEIKRQQADKIAREYAAIAKSDQPAEQIYNLATASRDKLKEHINQLNNTRQRLSEFINAVIVKLGQEIKQAEVFVAREQKDSQAIAFLQQLNEEAEKISFDHSRHIKNNILEILTLADSLVEQAHGQKYFIDALSELQLDKPLPTNSQSLFNLKQTLDAIDKQIAEAQQEIRTIY